MEDLRSGIEHLKQAKAHMSEANGIMNGHISKLKALEEENAELKAELADWKGNAEGFEPDAYMKLPLDADGVPIEVGNTVYCDGEDEPLMVSHITDSIKVTLIDSHASYYTVNPSLLSHERPDSWERLEEDAALGVEAYREERRPERRDGDTWPQAVRRDIVRRARALAERGQ